MRGRQRILCAVRERETGRYVRRTAKNERKETRKEVRRTPPLFATLFRVVAFLSSFLSSTSHPLLKRMYVCCDVSSPIPVYVQGSPPKSASPYTHTHIHTHTSMRFYHIRFLLLPFPPLNACARDTRTCIPTRPPFLPSSPSPLRFHLVSRINQPTNHPTTQPPNI